MIYNFLKDKTVLYIEDELDVLENISTLLGNFFGKFYTASDGLVALDIFYDKHIDLLLVDIELPKMSGIELIKEIRQNNKHVPIVVISAYTKTDYLLESVELGLEKYIGLNSKNGGLKISSKYGTIGRKQGKVTDVCKKTPKFVQIASPNQLKR